MRYADVKLSIEAIEAAQGGVDYARPFFVRDVFLRLQTDTPYCFALKLGFAP